MGAARKEATCWIDVAGDVVGPQLGSFFVRLNHDQLAFDEVGAVCFQDRLDEPIDDFFTRFIGEVIHLAFSSHHGIGVLGGEYNGVNTVRSTI